MRIKKGLTLILADTLKRVVRSKENVHSERSRSRLYRSSIDRSASLAAELLICPFPRPPDMRRYTDQLMLSVSWGDWLSYRAEICRSLVSHRGALRSRKSAPMGGVTSTWTLAAVGSFCFQKQKHRKLPFTS